MKTLPKLAEEATDSQLVAAFEKHLTETEAHVENVEAAFESIGKSPKAEKCPGIEGLKTEHDEFVSDENPSPDVLDMFLTGAAARTEHYEIAAYTMAQALGEDQPRPCFPRTSSGAGRPRDHHHHRRAVGHPGAGKRLNLRASDLARPQA